MAGIYVHIPYCKVKCPYCDFFSVTGKKHHHDFLRALSREIALQVNYLGGRTVDTLYFGGGTPSVFDVDDLKIIFDNIYKTFPVANDAEKTIECNPDDMSLDYFRNLKAIGFNRISLGLQSFQNKELEFLGRRHTVRQNHSALYWAFKSGFGNVSIDLIYGIPGSTPDTWKNTLALAFDYPFSHLSAYHLTIEPATVFGKKYKKGALEEVDEENSLEQFRILLEQIRRRGFEHYELSNFALPRFFSQHNTSYWRQIPYLGLGPSAHSYNGESRQWNVSDIKLYTEFILRGRMAQKQEELTKPDHFNEYIITRLRTQWGVGLKEVYSKFGEKYKEHLLRCAEPFMKNRSISLTSDHLVLTDKGKFISDTIFRELMWTD